MLCSSLDKRGIGIDIFPLDGLPQDLDKAKGIFDKQNGKFIKVINRLYTYALLPADSVINVVKSLVGRTAMVTGFTNLVTRQIAEKMYDTEYAESDLVACVTGLHSGRFLPFKKDWFSSEKLDFEGESFNCPSGYDEILKSIYDNYMKIPPEAERQSTHTEAFAWRRD